MKCPHCFKPLSQIAFQNSSFDLQIYTDGACSGNPGPGGYGVVVLKEDRVIYEAFSGEDNTTNNRMEMLGVIVGLEYACGWRPKGCPPYKVQVITDSKYVIDGITKWVHGWKKNGWKTAAKKPVVNQDLWKRLDVLQTNLNVSYRWVKGHAGHKWNERADELARQGIKMRVEKTDGFLNQLKSSVGMDT